ncbi:MAG: carbon storage regulator [Planctomycetaceae bacterium]
MLVLSRCVGESVIIGDDVRITLAECSGGRIKLRVDAPPDVTIRRGEAIQRATTPDDHPRVSGVCVCGGSPIDESGRCDDCNRRDYGGW